MKAYPAQCQEILAALHEVMIQGHFIEHAVKKHTSSPQQGSKDRQLIAATLFNIIKNYRLYSYLSAGKVTDHPHLPHMLAAYFSHNHIAISRDDILPPIDPAVLAYRLEEINQLPAVKYSLPDWIYSRLQESYPEHVEEIGAALLTVAPIFIRVNNLKTNIRAVEKHFQRQNVDFSVINHECLLLKSRVNLSKDTAYARGFFEIQDAGSQEISKFASPQPRENVIDACAGAGGKTLHLATLMDDTGHILALDVNKEALKQLSARATRQGVEIVTTHHYDDISQQLDTLHDSADLVLCDVPCSGSGVWRRETDKKLKFQESDFTTLLNTQQEILHRSANWVKPGGRLIYATCSILKEENEAQVNKFLSLNNTFTLEDHKTLLPRVDGHDGFYMARLRKIT